MCRSNIYTTSLGVYTKKVVKSFFVVVALHNTSFPSGLTTFVMIRHVSGQLVAKRRSIKVTVVEDKRGAITRNSFMPFSV